MLEAPRRATRLAGAHPPSPFTGVGFSCALIALLSSYLILHLLLAWRLASLEPVGSRRVQALDLGLARGL